MFVNDSGIIEIDCDAPPYPIVQACRELGFRSPEDVRWTHLGIALPAPKKRRGIWSFPLLRFLFRDTPPKQASCVCGHARPELASCKFVIQSEKEVFLDLGQCRWCNTIFWLMP